MRISGREESATAQQSVMHPRQPEKKMDYSHCPLKKRPVVFKCEFIKEEMDLENNQDCAEPENLSTKPEDLRVKYKSEIAAAALRMKIEPVSPDADKPPSPYPLPPLSPASEYRLGAIAWSPPRPIWSMDASPPPPPPPPERYAQQPYVVSHHHQQPYQQQHPYQPTAVKAGPLEPLCLNAAAGDHHHPAALAASAYHQHRQPYGPAAPRTVPAQYPATGYLSGYMYHHQPHGALAAERAFPPAPPAAAYPQPPAMGRDVSVSPPGSAGSAFRPLSSSHGASPSSAPATSPPSTPATSATAATWSRSSLLAWSQAQYVKLQSSSPGISPPPPPPPTSSTSPPSSTPYIVGPSRQLIAVAPYPQQRHAAAAATATVATIVENNGPSSSAAVKRKTSVGRYKCASCAKTYSSLSGLTKHQHSQHSSDDDSAAVALYGSAIAPASAAAAAAANVCTAKTFSCKFCDKTYTTLGALKMHIRTHTLPCLCTLCGKAFSRPWLLQGHIRTHTGEKPFSCSLCHRAFADRSNLRAHLQTHSDVKKYSCPTCSKTFSRMSLLTKHNETGCPRLLQQLPHQQHQQQQHQQQQHEDQEMTEL